MRGSRSLLAQICALPPVPSRVPIYKGVSTVTTDQTTSSWTGIDIGVPHRKRIVVLAVHGGVAASITGVLNGREHFFRSQNTAHEFAILAFFAPDGMTTAAIDISATGSLRKEFGTYVLYPANHMPIDLGTATANTTTDATVTNMKVQAGGCLIYAGGQNGTLGAFTTTFSGQTVTEDNDAQYESASSFTCGRITTVSVSSDTVTLNLAETVSGTKRLTCASWGPAYREAA